MVRFRNKLYKRNEQYNNSILQYDDDDDDDKLTFLLYAYRYVRLNVIIWRIVHFVTPRWTLVLL